MNKPLPKQRWVWIFILGIFIPSLILGALALRSAFEQQVMFERQARALYQKDAEEFASLMQEAIYAEQQAFSNTVEDLLIEQEVGELVREFSKTLPEKWPYAEVGFVVTLNGHILAPSPAQARAHPAWKKFLEENQPFLGSERQEQFYPAPTEAEYRSQKIGSLNSRVAQPISRKNIEFTVQTQIQPSSSFDVAKKDEISPYDEEQKVASEKKLIQDFKPSLLVTLAGSTAKPPSPLPSMPALATGRDPQTKNKSLAEGISQADADSLKSLSQEEQNVASESIIAPESAPQKKEIKPSSSDVSVAQTEPLANRFFDSAGRARSSLNEGVMRRENVLAKDQARSEQFSTFGAIANSRPRGILARFAQDQLQLILWQRSEQAPDFIFAAMLTPQNLEPIWQELGEKMALDRTQVCLALLNEKGEPVWTSCPRFLAQWKQPLVFCEMGDLLPHWKAAIYPRDPAQFARSAHKTSLLVIFLVLVALSAIAAGSWLVITQTRKEWALVEQKSDFVSNVSHELKTPLTSIRIFSELLQSDKMVDIEKQKHYLSIIGLEAERLTRLINNVLDFDRMERKQRIFYKTSLDFHSLIAQVWQTQQLHLEEQGFRTQWHAAPPPYPIRGDADALSQVLLNLLSNAQKYSTTNKEIELRSFMNGPEICVSVLDRGIGVAVGEEEKIFEHFYRAHDNLTSHISGSGLGLTLAQQIAQEHGGQITYQPRQGGGSNFTLHLPLEKKENI